MAKKVPFWCELPKALQI